MSRRQVVMAISDRPDMRTARLRGGKGAHLAQMHSLGLPVPLGFTVTTTVARAFMERGMLPNRLGHQVDRELMKLEKQTGKKFGDPQNPLLLSVRSGAEVSMPGMMDTVLNLGMNRVTRDALAETVGANFADDCMRNFFATYSSALGCTKTSERVELFREVNEISPRIQLDTAINAVLNSWQSERAIAYRAACNIPDTLGTAVTVQAMVFGNRDERSGTGVVFSRNPITGEPELYGEFLPMAQGEDIVSGSRTPMQISMLMEWNPELYQELLDYTQRIETHLGAIADIEFTIESGTLYLLQCRAAKLTAQAAATFAVHQQWAKHWTKERAIQSLSLDQRAALSVCNAFSFGNAEHQAESLIGTGLPASPGAANGKVATSSEDAIRLKAAGERVVLVRPDTTPADLPGMLASDAIVTLVGGTTSHAAVVARELGIPAVVGIGTMPTWIKQGHKNISVCGTTGSVYEGLQHIESQLATKEVNIFRKWVTLSRPPPRIDFAAVHQQVDVSSLCMQIYFLESMAHAARGSTLEAEIVAMRDKLVVDTAERFACYLAIAVASELRYAWRSVSASFSGSDLEVLGRVYEITENHVKGSENILPVLQRLGEQQHTAFFQFAEKLFNQGKWERGIGGEKWAAIARAGHLFLSGTLTHTTFVDHVFDLRHNGGRLFDKHRMVRNESNIVDILDIKKRISSPSELLQEFQDLEYGYHNGTSQSLHLAELETISLWAKGVSLNLWKDTPYGAAKRALGREYPPRPRYSV
jgi:pyruvate,orthophosphate dikinase